MKKLKIKKRSGGFREIYVPDADEKFLLRQILYNSIKCKHSDSAHGFISEKNIVTNAMPHIGKKVTISFDIKDFFDSVTPQKVSNKIPKLHGKGKFIDDYGRGVSIDENPNRKPHEGISILDKCFPDGAARQGLPTSPCISNIAFFDNDNLINSGLGKIDQFAVYTRYADDLTISTDNDSPENIEKIKSLIKNIVSRSDFKLNEKKTKIQHSKAGKREICGIFVDDKGVSINRKLKRRIRALKFITDKNPEYKKLFFTLNGLIEFSKLKLPKKCLISKLDKFNNNEKNKTIIAEYNKISQEYGIKKLIEIPKKSFSESILDIENNILLITDPVYILGMSSFTNTWESCMALNKERRRGLYVFVYLKGCAMIAEIDKEKTTTIAGVNRNVIKRRCLIFKTKEGNIGRNPIYPKGADVPDYFMEALKKFDVKKAEQLRGQEIEGYIHGTPKLPYLDNEKPVKVKLKKGMKTITAYKFKF